MRVSAVKDSNKQPPHDMLVIPQLAQSTADSALCRLASICTRPAAAAAAGASCPCHSLELHHTLFHPWKVSARIKCASSYRCCGSSCCTATSMLACLLF